MKFEIRNKSKGEQNRESLVKPGQPEKTIDSVEKNWFDILIEIWDNGRMILQKHGKNTSVVEVTNISLHGLWLYVNGKEYFLPYEDYPWFKEARVSELHDVKLYHGDHLYRPKIDVDLAVDCLKNPEQFPLIYQ